MRFLLLGFLLIQGCSTFHTSPMGDCKQLCSSQKVEIFKDEGSVCKCQVVEEEDSFL